MRNVCAVLTLMTLALMLSTGAAVALPQCKGSPTKDVGVYLKWSNCVGSWSNKVVSISVEMKDGKAQGFGTWSHARGDKYIGMFKNSLPHGQGIMYYPNGTIEEGIWKAGLFQYKKKNTPQSQLL